MSRTTFSLVLGVGLLLFTAPRIVRGQVEVVPSDTAEVDTAIVAYPYGITHSLLYGAGALMSPYAFINAGFWDVFVGGGAATPEINEEIKIDEGGTVTLSWNGRLEFGITSYSVSDYGVHAKAQLVPPGEFRPALAVGVLNLIGAPKDIGRHGFKGGGDAYNGYIDRVSPYVVASYAARSDELPAASVVSLGWGAGHLLEDNPVYNDKNHFGGLFGSVMLEVVAQPDMFLSFILEHDGWDFNAGATLAYRGVEVTAGALAIDEGIADETSNAINQVRFFLKTGVSFLPLRSWLRF